MPKPALVALSDNDRLTDVTFHMCGCVVKVPALPLGRFHLPHYSQELAPVKIIIKEPHSLSSLGSHSTATELKSQKLTGAVGTREAEALRAQ